MNDWNYFFSALSQCGAAMIAIIGGFVISKLIDSENKFFFCLEEFTKLKNDYNDLVNRINLIEFKKYYYHFLYSAPLMYGFIKGNQFKDNNGKVKSNTELLKLLYDKYPNELFNSDNLILDFIKPIIDKPMMLLENYPDENDRERTSKLEKLNFFDELSKGTLTIIQDYKFKSENLISQFKLNRLKLKNLSKAFKKMRRTIFFLYFSLIPLVIYPLHFLPIATTENSFYTFDVVLIFSNILTFKNFLLFGFFIIISIIFLKFLVQTFSYIKTINDMKDSDFNSFTDITNYSKHFKPRSISKL